MIELHPEILSKDGKPEFAVLPYAEFLRVKEALRFMDMESYQRYGGFFDNLSIEELARRQGVKPITNIEDLAWPGDPSDWDGFEESVEKSRREYPLPKEGI